MAKSKMVDWLNDVELYWIHPKQRKPSKFATEIHDQLIENNMFHSFF